MLESGFLLPNSQFPSLSYFQVLLTCSVQKLEGKDLSCDFILRCHVIMPFIHSHVMEMTNHAFCTNHEDGTSTN